MKLTVLPPLLLVVAFIYWICVFVLSSPLGTNESGHPKIGRVINNNNAEQKNYFVKTSSSSQVLNDLRRSNDESKSSRLPWKSERGTSITLLLPPSFDRRISVSLLLIFML